MFLTYFKKAYCFVNTCVCVCVCVVGGEGWPMGGEGTKDQKIISLALTTAVGKTATVVNLGLAV